jgi:hypothetical protein
MPDDLYNRDFVAWSRLQADRLRRLAAGERVNDLDWANLIEEVEDLGRSETRAVESLLLQALIHAIKCAAWPQERAVRHWKAEIIGFLLQARRRYAPSMARALDLASLYADALRIAMAADVEGEPLPVAEAPSLDLDALLDEKASPDTLIARLRAT